MRLEIRIACSDRNGFWGLVQAEPKAGRDQSRATMSVQQRHIRHVGISVGVGRMCGSAGRGDLQSQGPMAATHGYEDVADATRLDGRLAHRALRSPGVVL